MTQPDTAISNQPFFDARSSETPRIKRKNVRCVYVGEKTVWCLERVIASMALRRQLLSIGEDEEEEPMFKVKLGARAEGPMWTALFL